MPRPHSRSGACCPRCGPRGCAASSAFYLALLFPYGFLVALNDGWNEQLVKRGWTDVGMPQVLNPGPNPSTALLIALTVVLFLTAFRVRRA